MSAKEETMTASPSARSSESQDEPPTPAPDSVVEVTTESRTEQRPVKKTVAALTRNIEATNEMIERTEQKVATARERPLYQRSDGLIAGLEKQLETLQARKAMLERLRQHEITHTDL